MRGRVQLEEIHSVTRVEKWRGQLKQSGWNKFNGIHMLQCSHKSMEHEEIILQAYMWLAENPLEDD